MEDVKESGGYCFDMKKPPRQHTSARGLCFGFFRTPLGGRRLGLEVRQLLLDRGHDGVEVDTVAAVVDGVVHDLVGDPGQLAELIGPQDGHHLAEILPAHILEEQPDAPFVDPVTVQMQKVRNATQ